MIPYWLMGMYEALYNAILASLDAQGIPAFIAIPWAISSAFLIVIGIAASVYK